MNTEAALARILEGWLDGGLADHEQEELLRMLAEDPELRHRFASQVSMLGATRAAADAHPRWLALFDAIEPPEFSKENLSSFEAATMSRIHADRTTRKSWAVPAAWGFAAAVALSFAGIFLMQRPSQSIGSADSASPAGSMSTASPRSIAVAMAASPGASIAPGDYLKPGVISQKEGWLTLQTLNGVSVTFDAPFEAKLIDLDRIHLAKGVARVRVPEGAEGFVLESPTFNVLDLGTEFATKVLADGTGTCRVFEGKADVFLLDSMGESKKSRRLAASESVQIDRSEQALRTIVEEDDAYPAMRQAPRPGLRLAPGYASTVMAAEPAGYWRFEEIESGLVPNEVPGNARMRAIGSASIAEETGGNHSGNLTHLGQAESFHIHGGTNAMFKQDFTISFFTQFSWLQNFCLVSGMRYDRRIQGHSLILQCYASLSKIGIEGSALHSELRNPPAWEGGLVTLGPARLQPLRWHHIAMTRDQNSVSIYLDGEVIARQATEAIPLDCPELFIGRLNGNSTQSRPEARGMVGHIDELALFTRALSPDLIRRLARTGDGGK